MVILYLEEEFLLKIITSMLMSNSNESKEYNLFFAQFIPKMILIGVIACVASLLLIGEFKLLLKGLYILIPATTASILAIYGKIQSPLNLCMSEKKELDAVLVFILIYIISVGFLINSTIRENTYFVSCALLGTIILFQILYMRSEKYTNIILLEIILCSLNLIWGLNLKYPLYYGSDLLLHFKLIELIVEQGHLSSQMVYYEYFPIYHIFSSITSVLINLPIDKSVFIATGIAYQCTILFTYIIFTKISCQKDALLSALILCYSRDFVYYGGYFVTRTMAFLYFLIFLYTLYNQNNIKIKIVSILILVDMTLVHQVSMLYISFILISIALIEYAFYAYKLVDNIKIKVSSYLLMVAAFINYWIYIAYGFFVSFINAFSNSFDALQTSIESAEYIASKSIVMTNINNIDSAIAVFFILIGVFYIFQSNKKGYMLVLASFSILFLLLYIRSPLYLIPAYTNIFAAQRIALLLLPFMAFAFAKGIISISTGYTSTRNRYHIIIVMLILVIFFYSSISNSFTAQDNPQSGEKIAIPTPYFTQNDLKLLNFIEKMNNSNIYSDYIVSIAFPLNHKVKPIQLNGNKLVFHNNSSTIIRFKELKERNLRFITGCETLWDPKLRYINIKDLNMSNINQTNLIYTSNDSYIYIS